MAFVSFYLSDLRGPDLELAEDSRGLERISPVRLATLDPTKTAGAAAKIQIRYHCAKRRSPITVTWMSVLAMGSPSGAWRGYGDGTHSTERVPASFAPTSYARHMLTSLSGEPS
jgi:hypothetical protein